MRTVPLPASCILFASSIVLNERFPMNAYNVDLEHIQEIVRRAHTRYLEIGLRVARVHGLHGKECLDVKIPVYHL